MQVSELFEINDLEIENLIGHLERISVDASGWETLYHDATTGALWEVSYPMSEMHGGGPRHLASITDEDAAQKYLFSKP